MQVILQIGKSERTVRASADSLHGVVRWLGYAIKKWGWVFWTCGILIAAGWNVWNWQWWVAYVPLVFLVEIVHKQ